MITEHDGEGGLYLEDLTVTFSRPSGDVRAVRGVSLSVHRGECLGVVGESGAGKSQAFLAALGLSSHNARVSGRVRLGSRELLGMSDRQLDEIRGARIGWVFQDPMSALTPHMRIGEQMAEPLRRHRGLTARDAAGRALALLKRVYVTDAERRMLQYPHELSGGMRQRVMIAIAISCDPEVLIADEPTTALDVTVQAQILSLLSELKRSRGMAMVLITHDMGAVAGVADRVAVMRGGRLVEVDTVRAVFRAPRHEYTRALLAAVPAMGGAPAFNGTVARDVVAAAVAPAHEGSVQVVAGARVDSRAVDGAVARYAAEVAAVAPAHEGSVQVGAGARVESQADGAAATRYAAEAAAVVADRSPSWQPVLVLENVRVEFPVREGLFARRRVLRAVDDVSLTLAAGEAVGIVGESGSGKTTLARTALQLVRGAAGRVVWLGRPVEGLTQRELRPLRHEVQVIFQDPLASLDPRMTAAETIAEPLRVHRQDLNASARRAAVQNALSRVNLDSALASRYPHELSGGQCQRVAIARAIALEPRVLICDEPVSALDVTVQQQIVTLLADLKRESGLAILFISHNLVVVRQLCERVLVLYLGRMMELAPVAEIYTRPRHPYTRELLDSAPVADPEIQPARLARAMLSEPPSPLSVPSGCVYRTRCPHAVDVCVQKVPAWEIAEDPRSQSTERPVPGATHSQSAQRLVACHRWGELASRPEIPATDPPFFK